MVKTAKNAGADERTPSVPQYFSWINNTNEGATEQHTLINLDFFKYLKDTNGMQIKIYALDAGNVVYECTVTPETDPETVLSLVTYAK